MPIGSTRGQTGPMLTVALWHLKCKKKQKKHTAMFGLYVRTEFCIYLFIFFFFGPDGPGVWNASAALVNFASYGCYMCTWKSAVHQNLSLSGQGDQQNKTSNTKRKLLVTLAHYRWQWYLNGQGDKTKQKSKESQKKRLHSFPKKARNDPTVSPQK